MWPDDPVLKFRESETNPNHAIQLSSPLTRVGFLRRAVRGVHGPRGSDFYVQTFGSTIHASPTYTRLRCAGRLWLNSAWVRHHGYGQVSLGALPRSLTTAEVHQGCCPAPAPRERCLAWLKLTSPCLVAFELVEWAPVCRERALTGL